MEQPCEELSEITELTAKANYLWQVDTISKYNRCALSKDALVNIYNQIRKGNSHD
nr:MAG TPA: hypothetical protein [Caudoviricetes sp.]DAU27334.1 MAG TPA: hypothetical protein [Caudoviricetes sp.]